MGIYAALLKLYPASFRAEYGAEMAAIFARRRRAASGGFEIATLWLEAIRDTLTTAARVHADILRQDLRYTARTLCHTPGFTITVVLVAAIGIGASTTAFSIMDHVLIRPLPFTEPGHLVKLWQDQSFRGYSRMELSPGNYRDWQRLSTSFSGMAAYTGVSMNLVGSGAPQRLDGTTTTVGLFGVLGVRAALGRVFAPADGEDGAPLTAIISDSLWRVSFGADPDIIGRTVLLDDERHTIVGVMPRNFFFPSRETDVWTPLRFAPDDYLDRTNVFLRVVARLQPGVGIERARADLGLIAAQLERAFPKENEKTGATVVRLRDEVAPQARLLLWALSGAALCVLLIAVTNLANLLLARALGRRKELAVRMAIGAGPERLVRQMLTESLVLALAGGIGGVVLATVSAPLVGRLVPTTLPIAQDPAVDLRVMVAALVITVAAGVAFGIVPALRVRRSVDIAGLREGSRAGSGPRTERLRAGLVVAEVTVCVVLLVSSGLLIRALWRVQSIDPGFRADGVLTLRSALPLPKYGPTARRVQFYKQVVSEVEGLPGVSRAAFISFLPMGPMRGGIWPVSIPDRALAESESPVVSLRFVTPGFFDALQIPVRRGRILSEADTSSAPSAAVVSESFARQHWPDADPIGRRFRVAFLEPTIVGIVGDIKVRGLERVSEPQVYLSYQQVPDNALVFYMPKDLVIRSSAAPGTLVPAVRAIVGRADPALPLSDIRSLPDIVAAETAPRLVQLRALGAFAVSAFVLAALGIHGLLAFAVSHRTREIGVRIALGARSSDILTMVLRHGLGLAAAGVVLGTALAYVAGRSMETLLAGIDPGDRLVFASSAALALGMALVGSLLPALRAVRVDPLTATRAE